MELKALRISEKKQEILKYLNITCVEELLTHYPFRYEQIAVIPYEDWKKDEKVALEGLIITRAHVVRFGGKRSMTKFKIVNEEGEFDISIFNRPWVSQFKLNEKITIIGRYEGRNRITASTYNFKPLMEQLGMEPVYTIREGITQKEIRTYIQKAWQAVGNQITDFVPKEYRATYRLISRKEAVYFIHHPKNFESVKQALRHLKLSLIHI